MTDRFSFQGTLLFRQLRDECFKFLGIDGLDQVIIEAGFLRLLPVGILPVAG